mmetsp:Transcript_77867/g.196603  ORF Transcript_77867/g.196603 Transcript_77867/m.196603 type:complete len:226 (-) Transcript_77867:3671-4348(-)
MPSPTWYSVRSSRHSTAQCYLSPVRRLLPLPSRLRLLCNQHLRLVLGHMRAPWCRSFPSLRRTWLPGASGKQRSQRVSLMVQAYRGCRPHRQQMPLDLQRPEGLFPMPPSIWGKTSGPEQQPTVMRMVSPYQPRCSRHIVSPLLGISVMPSLDSSSMCFCACAIPFTLTWTVSSAIVLPRFLWMWTSDQSTTAKPVQLLVACSSASRLLLNGSRQHCQSLWNTLQ